jgi:hypothetical protein
MKMAFCSGTTWFRSGHHKECDGNAPISTSVSCLLAAWLFSGCIPVVTPALLSPDSRADLTAASQRGIEVGKTTRVDVLLALGEPDGRAADDRWFTYSSLRASSAGWLDIFGGLEFSKSTVNRLVVQFDATSIVSSVDFQQSHCSDLTSGQRCLDVRGTDLLAADIASGKMGTVLLNYNTASFSYSSNEYCTFANSGPSSYGPFALTDREIVMGETVLSYSRIAAVLPFRKGASGVVRLKRNDGICVFIGGFGRETDSVRVHDLILQQLQPVSRTSNPTTP